MKQELFNKIFKPEQTCTFFGHRNTGEELRPYLREAILALIEGCGVTRFFVGHHGNFDRMVLETLRELHESYRIRYWVVLSDDGRYPQFKPHETLRRMALHVLLPKERIPHRNRLMIRYSGYVVAYVTHPGGAAYFVGCARKAGKTVINLADNL